MKYLENESDYQQIIKKDLVLVDFYADWCGPCQLMSKELEKIKAKNKNLEIVKINVDKFQNLAMEHGVMSIPTIKIYKSGKEINKIIGYVSSDELESLLG